MSIMLEDWAGIWREGSWCRFPLSLLGDLKYPFHQLLECCATFATAFVSHLGQFVHVLTRGLQAFDRASIFESGAVSSDVFELISQTSIWANTFTKYWALFGNLIELQKMRILQDKTKLWT